MDTIRELTTSLRSYIRDRLTNPIYGAFLIAWIALNFRLFLVIFGDGAWREKISFIDSTLYPDANHWFRFGFVYPFLIGVAFVFAAPFLNRWATIFLRTQERDTLARLLVIEGETPLTKEQADVLRQSLLTERKRRVEELEEARREIDELQQQLELAANAKAPTSTAPSSAEPLLTAEQDDDHMMLAENDFVGVPQRIYITAARRGLTRDQARALYAMRNEDFFDLDDLRNALRLPEHHAAKVLIDQLRGMSLIQDVVLRGTQGFQITSAGSQALAAVTKRGFKGELT